MRKVIATEQAPAAVGPYSQAIQAGELIFTAGQLGLDPATGAFAGKDVASQTRQAMENIAAILTAAGTTLDQIVKTTIFVADMGDFQTVNAVYAEFFASDPPARSTVEVSALPLGGRVEIEVIAVVG
jgi:2-iminobutanoate/2-iminopropanoate deaminase